MTVTNVIAFDVLRDSRHRDARSARDQADWLTWLDLGGIRPRTLDDYERATAVALRMFPNFAFDEFTDGELVHVFKTFPPTSRRIRVAAYRSWFKWGVQTRRLERNPMDLMPKMRQPPRKPVNIYTAAEIRALEALPSPDGPLMAVLLRTGIRKGEARRLRRRHIDLGRGNLQVVNGKGGKDRDVPLYSDVIGILDGLLTLEGINPDDYLWHTRPGGGSVIQRDRPIGEGSFARWWRRSLEQANVRYLNPHAARHTYATTWRRRGLPVDEIQLLLGHESIRTTSDLYVQTDIADVAAHMAQILDDLDED